MKKFLLTLAVALMATSSYATREVDWSVDTIYTPIELNSTDAGTTYGVHVVLKNNGVDTVWATDTIGIQFGFIVGTTLIHAYPNAQQILIYKCNKKVAPGDTIHYKGVGTTSYRSLYSLKATFFFYSVIRKTTGVDNIVTEIAPTTANNTKQRVLTWWCPQKWGVGINEMSSNLTTVYPNPASDMININMNVVDMNSPSVLSIMDVTGKVIYTETAASASSFSISTATFPKGLYLVQVKNGELTSTTKVAVQ